MRINRGRAMSEKQFEECRKNAKLHHLKGTWMMVDQFGNERGNLIPLGYVNGFYAIHRTGASCFVVTTGKHKGIWMEVSHH